jgi:ribonucleoside-diphosphate reductase alpha chain
VFAESLYFLLCGAGVGYSVRFDHVDKLPTLKRIDVKDVEHHVIGDSIEGWAHALDALVNSYMMTGKNVEFAYHEIRAAGTPLRTSGGKAPGHVPLKLALERIREVLHGAQGRKLRPIEAHDMLCHAADAVLSGGVRRSSLISFFSIEDSEMLYAKTGDWWKTHPWRQNANNSVALKRGEVSEKLFRRVFQMTREWGEPGFCFVSHEDVVGNPCLEILMLPKTIDGRTGFSGCNLTEINAAKFTSYEDFEETARAAVIVGTVQSGYTDFKYLGDATKEIFERDALLGVSITGMLDAPDIACNPIYQQKVAGLCVEWNKQYAKRLGINSAARVTCVKPSGTASLALGGVASGHHAHHARRYIRRVTANEMEPVFQFFRSVNPHMCVRKPNGDWVIEFPIEAPDGATVKDDLGAVEFLSMVKSTQENWVKFGVNRPDPVTGDAFEHNVSNTVQVKPDEWNDIADYIWRHRDVFTGVSLLPATGDKDYAFAPCEAVVTDADESRWNQILAEYTSVDYSLMIEADDTTNLKGEAACAGGQCEIR